MAAPGGPRADLAELIDRLVADAGGAVTATRRFAPRPPRLVSLPDTVDPRLADALRSRGIEALYSHQARALELLAKGGHCVVVTPTASGKTLCYNLPVLQALLTDPSARALYLFPTKALAQDQLAELEELARALPELRIHTYDGDTPQDARRAVRARANLVLSNPDMLHAGILPHHTKWVALFQNLRYVIIDELHTYRGVFGSHLANVLRRLHRVCRHYGTAPQFVCASATIANPQELAERLIGQPVGLVSENGAPSGAKVLVFYNPPVVNAELGIRRPYLKEAARLASPFLKHGISTITFAGSRLAQEVLLATLKTAVERPPGLTNVIRGYRGGYLPGRRREIERGLREGEVLGVVSTNALELGIDIGHLDLAVLAGYPGTIASTWQQIGRAGRRSGLSAAVLVASSAPLDQFMVTHPDYFFGASPEHGLINPDNPYVLVSHLKCAAFELPFVDGEAFGERDVGDYLRLLAEEGLLHAAGGRWHWTSESYPADHLSLRTVGSDNFVVIDTTHRELAERQLTKKRQVIAEVDWKSAFSMIYPKAIYLIEGEQFEVQELHFREDEEKVAYVKRIQVDYFTDAITAKGVWALDRFRAGGAGVGRVAQGELLVAEQVVGFKKIKFDTMENVGSGEVELPQQEMQTAGLWLTIPPETLAAVSRDRDALVDGLRGLTYLLHHLAPLFLMCDVRDLGSWLGDAPPDDGPTCREEVVDRDSLASGTRPGVATRSPDAGVGVLTAQGTRARLLTAERFEPTVYLYDNQPGGIGLAEKLFELLPPLLARARETLAACPCRAGCPSCVGPVNAVGRQAKPLAAALVERLQG
ncbi:MAG TPA: DEAD/DEAH box helicase [Methylomirabilota bacterium]|jgi:DEAD/DEAH box helicase domain-containing protein|nr:DEAD/DEAH box helicase [Methylomirabilota bacterium]